MHYNFLLIDHNDQSQSFINLSNALSTFGTLCTVSTKEAIEHLNNYKYTVIIIDASATDNEQKLIKDIKQKDQKALIVVITSSPTWQQARDVFFNGAVDYISKMLSEEEYCFIFKNVLDIRMN